MASTVTTGNPTERGSLIIAGSGIASVGQITLETLAYLKKADKVFYLVGDPATEAFILENNENSTSLFIYYDRAKHRYQTYVEMAEVIVREVRAGHNVFGIFYGHPGVFSIPSHRAIALARQEGYAVRMLPGVSAIDYMFADIEFDPGNYGCATYDATELLVREGRLDVSVHNIILQIGVVGIATLEYENSKFQRLVDRLVEDFGPDHRIVHYVGASLPQASSTTVVFTIEDLRNEEVANQLGNRSSLYIPPRQTAPISAAAATTLQLPDMLGLLATSSQWDGHRFIEPATYGLFENTIVTQLDQHVPPDSYKSLRASDAMRRFMIDLALEPDLLRDYKVNPSAVVEGTPGLTESEQSALKIATEGPIFAVMSRNSDVEPTEEELAEANLRGHVIVAAAGPNTQSF